MGMYGFDFRLDEEDEVMTRNEALALYRPIRASIRRILSLAVPVCDRADLMRAAKQLGLARGSLIGVAAALASSVPLGLPVRAVRSAPRFGRPSARARLPLGRARSWRRAPSPAEPRDHNPATTLASAPRRSAAAPPQHIRRGFVGLTAQQSPRRAATAPARAVMLARSPWLAGLAPATARRQASLQTDSRRRRAPCRP
jgi:hypothetical protein